MRSIREILRYAEERSITLPEAVLAMDAEATGILAPHICEKLQQRCKDMERSVREARQNRQPAKLVAPLGSKIRAYKENTDGLSGAFVLNASAIALDVATYNAVMGRIVAAPTAGSCGILPGLLFAWAELHDADKSNTQQQLINALIVAGAFGEVIANRATLAGAEGGCQAECGAAAAMGAAALAYLQGGSDEAAANAAALTLKSILGLVCDPVGGLVEVACIKRNGLLVALAALAADMALAGVKSVIPVDEVIDAMAQVGRAMPTTLRETSKGGLAVTPTGRQLACDLCNSCIAESGND